MNNKKKIKLSSTLHNVFQRKQKKKKNVKLYERISVFFFFFFRKCISAKCIIFSPRLTFFSLHEREARCKLVESHTKLVKYYFQIQNKVLVFLEEQSQSSDRQEYVGRKRKKKLNWLRALHGGKEKSLK